jgi:outer membrane receptor protein involved in Fe transport
MSDKKTDAENGSTLFGKVVHRGFSIMANRGTRTKHIPTGTFGTDFNRSETKTVDTRSFVDLSSEHLIAPNILLSGKVYYDWYDYDGIYMYGIKNIDEAKARSYGEEIRVRLTPWGAAHSLTVGQEMEKTTKGLQQNYYEGSSPDVDVNTTYDRWAVYLQQEWKPLSRLFLGVGARYDHYGTFGEAVSPRASAIYQPTRFDTLKLLYGTAFRSPSAYEMFYGADTTFVINPELNSEKITSYELVWERKKSGPGLLTLAAYKNKVTNLINQTSLPGDKIQFQNEGIVESIGVEVYARQTWNRIFSSFCGLNIQRTQDEKNNRLSNSPTKAGSAGIVTTIAPWKSTMALQGFFIGSRQTFRDTRLPPAAVFSLTLRADPWKKGPVLFGSLYNIFDTNLAASGAAEHEQAAIPQNGRHFAAGMKWSF